MNLVRLGQDKLEKKERAVQLARLNQATQEHGGAQTGATGNSPLNIQVKRIVLIRIGKIIFPLEQKNTSRHTL